VAHQGHSGEVSLAREGQTTVNFASAELGSSEGIGDSGGELGRPSLILVEGMKGEERRTFGRAHLLARRRLAAGRGGGHGGSDGHARGEEKQRKGERACV
jgi:hypothetical protein